MAVSPLSDHTKFPQESPKRAARRRELMGLAARLMNLEGAAAITPAAVAAAAGMSRNSLYHYFRDKEALIRACYQDSASRTLERVEQALEGSVDPAESLSIMVSGLLAAPDDVAILHDLDLLPEPEADAVRQLQFQALQGLRAIFDAGVKRGDFREIPTGIAAHVLLGMVDWARLWDTWRDSSPASPDENARRTKAIVDSLLLGFRGDDAPEPAAPPVVDTLLETVIDVLDRESIGVQKRDALLGVASRLFNRRGIGTTSIDDIALAARATKGFVYHHFASKGELVYACYDRAFDQYDRFANAAEAAGGIGAIESLTWPMHLNAQVLLTPTPPLVLQSGAATLPARHRARARRIAERFRRDMQSAIERGVARPFAMDFIELSAGAFFWIPRWEDSARTIGPYTLGSEIVDLLSKGVACARP